MKFFATSMIFATVFAAGAQNCVNRCDSFNNMSLAHVLSAKHVKTSMSKTLMQNMVFGSACVCTNNNNLVFLKYQNKNQKFIIEKQNSVWYKFKLQQNKYTSLSFKIKHSFLKDGIKAGINSKILKQAELMFKERIRFNKDLHKGDKIKLLVEHKKSDVLVMASIVHNNNVKTSMRFNSHGKSNFYDMKGHAMVDSFDRVPIKYTRISSPFRKSRKHPILGYARPHRGVDLAAPSGTPIHATSAGQIVSLGALRGYGRTVIIKHHGNYQTLYAHMHAYAKGLKIGDHVTRKQLIGYVGMTGLATAPHCHYEFRIGNVAYDPMKVRLPKGEQLTGIRLKRYKNIWAQRYKMLM